MFSDKVVMIVDDDPTLLEMYVERIKSEGAIVLEAIDGEEALKMAKDNHPAVVLLDVMMPKINGFDVLRQLKADPDTEKIPVVILTALADDQRKHEGLQIGATDFIVKSEMLPLDVIEKLRKIISPDLISEEI